MRAHASKSIQFPNSCNLAAPQTQLYGDQGSGQAPRMGDQISFPLPEEPYQAHVNSAGIGGEVSLPCPEGPSEA